MMMNQGKRRTQNVTGTKKSGDSSRLMVEKTKVSPNLAAFFTG